MQFRYLLPFSLDKITFVPHTYQMEIKTLDNKIVDTDKLPDAHSEMIETVERSGIRDMVMKYDGFCFMVAAVPGSSAWTTMHVPNKIAVDRILESVNRLILDVTEKKFELAVVPVETV